MYDPANTDRWQIDLRADDASGVDLRDPLGEQLQAYFDTTTRPPAKERLPAGLGPESGLDLGMNPGFGLRARHAGRPPAFLWNGQLDRSRGRLRPATVDSAGGVSRLGRTSVADA